MKIGFGYDIHPLKKGRKLFLGGVRIPFHSGLFGHSDADVLLHAISDALLGAAGLGDIGIHFPNTDKRYKDISSLILLKNTFQKLNRAKIGIINVDAVIVADEPKVSPYFPEMKKNISKILKLPPNLINIKATSSEDCLFPARKKAIISYAVALVKEL